MTFHPLPEEWMLTSLGDVVVYGKTVKVEPSEIQKNEWVLELEDIEKHSSKITQRFSFSERASKSTKNRFAEGDVLYGKLRPYLNKIVIADQDGVCTTEIIPLRGGVHLDNRYLFYWLKHPKFLKYTSEVSHGLNMPRLGTKQGQAAPFVLAPLAEQKQIANKLEELLAQVDSIKSHLDAIPSILKRFRQSVLAAAVSGRLTEDWRGTTEFGRTVNLGELTHSIRYGTSKKCDRDETGVPVLRIPNIGDGGLELEDLKYARFDAREIVKLALEEGDLLVIRSNGSVELVGKAAVVTGQETHCLFAGYLIRIRLDKSLVEPEYVLFCLQSPTLRSAIELKARSTSGVNNINTKELSSLEIQVPDLEEQVEIARKVKSLFSFAGQIEQRLTEAKVRVNQLTQSILAKAFRGELTAEWREQYPGLISGRNSAQTLLERIQVEREKLKSVKSTRKKRAVSPNRGALMTKSRHDEDVWHKPYLSSIAGDGSKSLTVEDLFQKSDLPVEDFYKQLAWESDAGHLPGLSGEQEII